MQLNTIVLLEDKYYHNWSYLCDKLHPYGLKPKMFLFGKTTEILPADWYDYVSSTNPKGWKYPNKYHEFMILKRVLRLANKNLLLLDSRIILNDYFFSCLNVLEDWIDAVHFSFNVKNDSWSATSSDNFNEITFSNDWHALYLNKRLIDALVPNKNINNYSFKKRLNSLKGINRFGISPPLKIRNE